jgi:DNA-binding MarR family transcriptional regulator
MSDAATDLSERWHELTAVLRSRRLLAQMHEGGAAGLTPTKLRALTVLGREESVRVGELAERMGVDETTATRLADRLERDGLAERRRDQEDRRVALVVLTRSGRRLANAAAEQRHRFFEDVLAALEPAERSELVRLTAKAADALQGITA